ncbi:DNase I-like protein, partial [Trametes coccinea BRFM310]
MARKAEIRVGSLNMNGFGSLTKGHPENKWGKIYRMMSEENLGILLIQETHLTEARRTEVQRMFAGRVRIFHSEHASAPTQREGVAVVINKKIACADKAEPVEIVAGRALQVTIPWRGGDKRTLLCIYAPTSGGASERAEFFRAVKVFYETHPEVKRPCLMAGDFNNVEDPLDRYPVGNRNDVSVSNLQDLKAFLGLASIDGWRAINQGKRAFTFHRGTGEQATMSRLDRIYIKAGTLDRTREWAIKPVGVKTDHNMVSVQMTTLNAPEMGRGRRLFPLFLLKDKALARGMKEVAWRAEDELREIERVGRTDAVNPQTTLTNLKEEWMKLATEREKRVAPKMAKEIKELEKGLEKARESLTNGDNRGATESILITEQLRTLKEKRYTAQQQHIKAKHREAGEKPTKYWVSLNRAKKPREVILALQKEKPLPNGRPDYELSSKRMAEIAKEHYDGVQVDDEGVTHGEEREANIQDAIKALTRVASATQVAEMEEDITYEQVEFALQHAKMGTAPGADGLQYEVWKTMAARCKEDRRHEKRRPADVVEVIRRALRDVQDFGVCAGSSFAEGWVVPIYKEKGEKSQIVNYRPITLLNTDYKVLTKILSLRL